MIGPNILRAGLLAAALALAAAAPVAAADSVRPEVGKPLQAADSLYRAKKYREALAKVSEADAVAGKTPFEAYMVQRTRGSIAAAAGDSDTAAKAFEAVIASGRLSGAEQLKMVQAVAGLHYQSKDYARAAQWAARYQKEGGTDPAMRTVLVQSYFLGNDCASVSRVVGDVDDARNGRRASEPELQILANCYLKQKDNSGYVAALEKLVTYYPKREYWTDLLSRVQRRSGLAEDEVRRIMATQLPRAERLAQADDVVDNGGPPDDIEAQVDVLDRRYRELARRARETGDSGKG